MDVIGQIFLTAAIVFILSMGAAAMDKDPSGPNIPDVAAGIIGLTFAVAGAVMILCLLAWIWT